jgi:hypothetical protein
MKRNFDSPGVIETGFAYDENGIRAGSMHAYTAFYEGRQIR